MTRLLVRKRVSKPKGDYRYPWSDEDDMLVIYEPNVYEQDGPQPTGILDPNGEMIFKSKEPVGFHNFQDS
jgi:hypothetical protein